MKSTFVVLQLVLHKRFARQMSMYECVCLFVIVWMSFPSESREEQNVISTKCSALCVCLCAQFCLCAKTIFRRIERQRTLPYSIIQPFLSVAPWGNDKLSHKYHQTSAIFRTSQYRYVWTCDSFFSLSLFSCVDSMYAFFLLLFTLNLILSVSLRE